MDSGSKETSFLVRLERNFDLSGCHHGFGRTPAAFDREQFAAPTIMIKMAIIRWSCI
jgi:hypothetical protein